MGGKLLNRIRSVYVNSLACVRVKGDESEYFSIDCGERHGCIISPWLFNVYMDTIRKEENGDGEEGRDSDELVLCGDLEEDLRAMVGCFIEICRRRVMKVNADKSKVMVLNGKEG